MKTPQDRYRADPQFRQLVDMMEYQIEGCHFTPSELREAAILASIHYETRRVDIFRERTSDEHTAINFIETARRLIDIRYPPR